MKHATRRSGLTLVELTIALGLLAVMLLFVMQVFDRSLTTWRNAETRRAVMEAASVASELVTADLRGIEGGPRGDFLLEWVTFDTNGDGVRETKWPRLRLVRQASGAESARVQRDLRLAAETRSASNAGEVRTLALASGSELEVVWMVVPSSTSDRDARSTGMLWRGERLVTDTSSKSFFAPDFLGASNLPPAGATHEVTGGILWFGPACASQSTDLGAGWTLGTSRTSAVASWDAWSRERPNPLAHPWNERSPDAVIARGRPVLPRRVHFEIEIERPVDRLRRTRLVEPIDNQAQSLLVDDGERVLTGPDAHVLLDGEWMKVTSVDGRRVVVERGQRGTTAVGHDKDALVHWGLRLTTEVTIPAHREEWGS